MSGSASYILPSFNNTRYIDINVGDHFGIDDIIGSIKVKNINENEWYNNLTKLQRQFTVKAT